MADEPSGGHGCHHFRAGAHFQAVDSLRHLLNGSVAAGTTGEEEEEEEEDGVGGGVACMQMRALDATAQTRCSDCVWTLGAEHSELSLSGATLSCLSCLSSDGWKKNMAAAPIPRSGIPPFRNLEKELC